MANRHFGKFADVWKHMVLDEVLVASKPARYAETHAGSAAYPMVHDRERRFGVLGFLDGWSVSSALEKAAFTRVVREFLDGQPSSYPGSALQAMTLLGDDCSYLLCDVDPVSADDLRTWAGRLGLSRCDVAQSDGLAAVLGWLPEPDPTVVHIDPFDPFEHEDGVPSAVELAAAVADAGHTLVYWYGVDNPGERAWAVEAIRSSTSAPLWCGDFMVTSLVSVPGSAGNLGDGTTPRHGMWRCRGQRIAARTRPLRGARARARRPLPGSSTARRRPGRARSRRANDDLTDTSRARGPWSLAGPGVGVAAWR
jgi:23S rRNA A2030 N6-methylase RlmJ